LIEQKPVCVQKYRALRYNKIMENIRIFKIYKNGFTLAEVLITLVIVGVVASLTIPTAIAKYREQQTIQSLKTTYSTFAQALKMAESKNGPVGSWDIAPGDSLEGSLKIYNLISPGLSKVRDCQGNNDCFGDGYITLQGTDTVVQPKSWIYARGILNNGVSFAVWSSGTCNGISLHPNMCGIIIVDINGYKKPNRFGYDTFWFKITENGLLPYGTTNSELSSFCKLSGTHRENGNACTAWVLYKNNFDYKKQNVSW